MIADEQDRRRSHSVADLSLLPHLVPPLTNLALISRYGTEVDLGYDAASAGCYWLTKVGGARGL